MQEPRKIVAANQSDRWAEYLKNTANKPPRKLVKRFVNYLNTYDPRHSGTIVVDIGCGAGNDTCYYAVNKNHQIIALDCNQGAITATTDAVNQHGYSNVSVIVRNIMAEPIPECDIASASLCMPFISPTNFTVTWENNIVSRIKPGGYFVGHFFGPNHAWRVHSELTFLSKEQVQSLFDKNSSHFEGLKFFKETQREVVLANGQKTIFHTVKAVARKKGGDPLELTPEDEENIAKDFFKKPF